MGLIITSPPDSHIELVKLALLAGLPVLVEKPLTLKLSEIEKQSIRLFDSTKTVMMAFNRRFWEPACRMRTELLANRNVGPTLAKLVLETNSKEWDAYSGDSNPLEDLGPHQFDLLRYLFNCEIVAVNARWITRAKIKVDVELEDGIIAECVAAHGNRYREYISVQHGHNQYQIFVDSERIGPGKGILRWILDFYDRLRRLRKKDLTPMSLSYDRQLKHFINCIRSGLEPNPGISSGIAAVQAIEAARKSIVLNGRRVLI
jgi:predicted dehydrogenase